MWASVFYDKTVFGIDTFRTTLTLHYIGSELDYNNSANGTNPLVPVGSFNPDNFPLNTRRSYDWQLDNIRLADLLSVWATGGNYS
jgi:hypothetical protein